MKASILCYKIGTQKMAQLRAVAAPLRIAVKEVAPEEIHQKVGYLAGLSGYESAEPAADMPQGAYGEFLLMCDLSKVQFDLLMGAFQRKRIAPIPVKAMMTPTNRDWSFTALMEEVNREHQSMYGKRV